MEINVGVLNGANINEYQKVFATKMEKFTRAPEGGENLTELRARVFGFIQDMEKKYKGRQLRL